MNTHTSPPALLKHNVGGWPLSNALYIANDISKRLVAHCDKIHIAGSVRREKPFVKDIEIVCLPKKETLWSQVDMFSGPSAKKQNIGEFGMAIYELGDVLKGNPYGKYMQIKLSWGINLDLFMPDSFDYYRQYAIRTGSAEYSAKVIAGGWRKLGWCGSNVGLRKMSDCVEKKNPDGKSIWKCVNENAERPPNWQSEEEFFDWLNVRWIVPEARTIWACRQRLCLRSGRILKTKFVNL